MLETDSATILGYLTSWFNATYFGISIWQYILSFLILLGCFVLKKFIEVFVLRWVNSLIARTSFVYDKLIVKALEKPLTAFIIVGGIHLAILTLIANLEFSSEAVNFLKMTYSIALGVLVIWCFYRLVDVFTVFLEDLAHKKKSAAKQFIPLIKKSLRAFVLIIGLLTILSTLNVNISSLLTGLGIGGIAISLAAKDTLSNFFGSVALLADRPFNVGDWIIVGDKVDGDVESIGFRSTKVRTWPKTLMTIPNSVLANEIVDNWSRMPKRRVKQLLGVTYDTGPDKMEVVLEGMRKILREDEGVDQEFFLIQFTDFGESSLDILVYYFTKSTKWKEYLDVRERINMKFMRCVEECGSALAFPTTTVHLEGDLKGLS